MSAGFWGSLLPAVWSFMLALRSRGLGRLDDAAPSATASASRGDPRHPVRRYSQAGLFPIAYTKGTDFKPAKRLPAEQVTHWDNW